MEFDDVVHDYVDATRAVEAAMADAKGATAQQRAIAKSEHNALRALLVDAGITRTSGQHDGQTYVIRIKETQSRRTPPVRDMAQELLNALIAPFDEVVLAGNDHPSAAAGLGPGVPVSFDDACNHIVCRAVSGLKERFIKYNTTLSVTKATAGESTGEAVPHPLRQHIQDRLSRHLRYKKIAAEMAAPLQERVKVAKSRQTAQLPTVEQLIDDHAPETWSLKVPTRLPSPEPVRVPSPPRRSPASRDERAMPPPPVRPPRSATRSTSMEALRPRNLSDAPVNRTESRTENRARSATTAPPCPALPQQQHLLRRKTRVKTPRLNFGDIHSVLCSVIGIVAAEKDCADASITIDELCRRLLEARDRLLPVTERELESHRDQKSTHENVVTIDRARRR